MTSKRLTTSLRTKIQQALLKGKFDEEESRLRKEKEQLALDIYEDVFGDRVEAMNDLPHGWLPEVVAIEAKIGEHYTALAFPSGTTKRVPNEALKNRCIERYPARSRYAKRYANNKAAATKLWEEKRKTKAEIRAVLDSVTTTKRLIEVWPEAADAVDHACGGPDGKKNDLAVNIDTLNKRLGLRAKRQETAND